jgi:hypothetical protein
VRPTQEKHCLSFRAQCGALQGAYVTRETTLEYSAYIACGEEAKINHSLKWRRHA